MDLHLLGLIALVRQERDQAAARLSEGLSISRDLFETDVAVDCLDLLAVTFPPSQAAAAARSWGAVAAFRDRAELPASPDARELVERAIEECRSELGNDRFEQAWAEGHSLSPEAAIDLGLSVSEQAVSA